MSLDSGTPAARSPLFEMGGLVLQDCSPEEAVSVVSQAARERRPLAVHLCNAYTVTLAAKDAAYASALKTNGLNLVDGTPVTWFYRLLTGCRPHGPVRGPSFMRSMLDEEGQRHYLYGGTDEVLRSLVTRIAVQHPAATVVGAKAPPFRPLDSVDIGELVADLRRTEADIVWVGLGTPKQDHLLEQLTSVHNCVAIGVGAAFDFLSGHKREAPTFLQGTGVEWAHRLLTEPRRLWRRYLVGNLAFTRLAFHELRSQRRHKLPRPR